MTAYPFNLEDEDDLTFQIKNLVDNHTCVKVLKNRNCTSKWIAETFIEKFQADIDYKLLSLQLDVKKKTGYHVSLTKCLRAKARAVIMVEGDHKGKYGRRLWVN